MKKNYALLQRLSESGLTHDQAAHKAGISRAYFTNIVANRKVPSIPVAKKIADALNTTVEEIFFANNVPKRNIA